MKNPKYLQYYLNLNYETIVKKVESDGEMGYEAYTKELSKDSFYGIGDTPAEAVESLEEVKKELFPYYLERGYQIPEPEPEEDDLPSGKFIIRTSPQLHKNLIKHAKRHSLSLNQYINKILDRFYIVEEIVEFAWDTMRFRANRFSHWPTSEIGKVGYTEVGIKESERKKYGQAA